MAEPKVRFKRDDGSSFPAWEYIPFSHLYTRVIEKNDLSFGRDKMISVANMYFKESDSRDVLDDDYMKTYNIMRLGDIAFEGNKSKSFAHGRFVENTIGDGIVSHVFDVFRPKRPYVLAYWKEYINYEPIMGKVLLRCTKSSTMMTNLVADDFLLQKIFVPSIEEQQKIADFLSSVDEVISTSAQEVANLETQKKAVMKKIFSQEVRFKKADGSDFPEWEEDNVGNRCNIQTGKSNTQDAVEDGEYPFYVRSPIVYRSNRYLFDTEAVITVGDGVGTGKVYHYVVGKFDLHQRAYAMTDFVGMTGRYFYYYFSAFFYDRVRAMTAKTSVDSVRYEMIDKMTIRMPCLEEQHLIADFLSDFDEAIAAAKKELELWKELKKGLLQQMFV